MDLRNRVIKTERLVLKHLDEDCARVVLDYHIRNREFLEIWSPLADEDYFTLTHQREALEKDNKKIEEGLLFRFWIFKKEDEKFEKTIGAISFNNIVRGCFQSCHMGYKLDKDEVNKGYMTEALAAAIDFAFQELELHRLEANVIPHNRASLKVLEKLGFYNEGIAKKYLKINGKWQDHIHMVILNNDLE